MSNAPRFELHFEDNNAPELVRTVYHAPGYDTPIVGLRACFAPKGTLSFRWQMITHAFAVIFVKAAARPEGPFDEPIVSGDSHSLAGRIGNMLRKHRHLTAFFDLVGGDSSGRSNLSRMIMCLNYNKRRPGPILVFYRPSFLAPKNIKVFCQGKELSGDALDSFANRLEMTWITYDVKREGKMPKSEVCSGQIQKAA